MRYVLPRSGNRHCRAISGNRPAAGLAAGVVPAGLACRTGVDRSRLVPASLLIGGGPYDEGGSLEKSQVSAWDLVQVVSCDMSTVHP